jgi:thiosulfate/3-mercaptopyruvate sulfurtransferase
MDSPLVSADQLAALIAADPPPAILDVRWELATGARPDLFEQGHIPSAQFVDLDADLASAPGAGGRHPLPAGPDFQSAMRIRGVSSGRRTVVYDAGPATTAARAWWLLRYFGHPAVSVLDGGLATWVASGRPLETGPAAPARAGDFTATGGGMPVLDAAAATGLAAQGGLLDARAPARFRGEAEPVDAVAGHIPGALNRPTTLNLEATGRLRSPGELRDAFAALGVQAETPVGAYCGSGVTAAHEILALERAGFRAALYPGSWSEWITDPARPVATGP